MFGYHLIMVAKHESNVMFRGTDILPDDTYTHDNNGSQTCSWLDHFAISDVLSEFTVDCRTLQDVAGSDHCAITVTLNFDQLPKYSQHRGT